MEKAWAPIMPWTGDEARSAACLSCLTWSGRWVISAAHSGSWTTLPGACHSGAAWRLGCCGCSPPAINR